MNRTQLIISTRDGEPLLDHADLSDDLPEAKQAYIDSLLRGGYELHRRSVTMGALEPVGEPPVEPPPPPETEVWLGEWAGPGTTTPAAPRIERELFPPIGHYTVVDVRVDVTLNAYGADNRWMDILAATRGVKGEWKNRDLLASLALRGQSGARPLDLKARAGMGTTMGDPDKTNDAGEFVHKSKKIVPFDTDLVPYRYQFVFNLPRGTDTFGRISPVSHIHFLDQHNLPADLETVKIGDNHSLLIHLGAIPVEGGAEGLTQATFSNLEVRMTPAKAAT